MRVLVIHPPMSIARDFIDYPHVSNLGAAQLAAVLATEHDVQLVDAFALPGSSLEWREDGRAHLGAPTDEVLRACGDADVAVVITTPFHRPPHRDDVLASILEGLSMPIVLADAYQSGQHYVEVPTLLEAYPEASAWVKYEAELTLPMLLREGIPAGVHVGERPDLATLPLPAWDRLDLKAYWTFHRRFQRNLGRGASAFPLGARTIPLVTSRGCPFVCVHCSSNPDRHAGAPKTQRRFSEAHLEGQLQQLKSLGADTAYVLDELINVRKSHFNAFLRLVADADLRFEVPNGFRADYLEPRHFARMRGRVTTVSVSAESGSDRVVRDVVDKQLDLGAIRRAAENAHRAGVPLLIHYMIGLPGETAAEVNETLSFALELWDLYRATPAVQYATPLPGTQLAAKSASLPVVDDWGPQFQRAPSGTSLDDDTLRLFMRTFRHRLRESRGPQKLIMNVTYVCNNHCTFCAVGTRTQVDGHPTRQREILDKYRRHGVELVDFDGGEPTLNPELVPLIRHARRIGYQRINVTTNGRLCAYEDFAKKLVTSGLTTLLFSVHGPDFKSHAREVGVAEAFDQTVGGIRHCVAHKPEGVDLGMNVTLTKTNYEKLPQLAQLAWDLGLRWLNIQFLTPFGRATTRFAPKTEDAAAVTRALIDDWHERIKIQVINLPWCYLPGYEQYLAGDAAKLARHMVFVNNESVNLADYLAARRVKKEECASCAYACFCSGFYELDDAPEPPWLVTPESLLKRTDPKLEAR
ncbi:MAG: radical SAM protein [Myxococcota bacterium]